MLVKFWVGSGLCQNYGMWLFLFFSAFSLSPSAFTLTPKKHIDSLAFSVPTIVLSKKFFLDSEGCKGFPPYAFEEAEVLFPVKSLLGTGEHMEYWGSLEESLKERHPGHNTACLGVRQDYRNRANIIKEKMIS